MDLFLKNAGWIDIEVWINTRNIRRGRFAFVDIGNRRGWHDKINNVRPAKTRISLGVFDVGMKKAWVLGYPLSAKRRLIRILAPWVLCLKMMCIVYLSFVTLTIGAGDIAGVKCHVLTSTSSLQCRGQGAFDSRAQTTKVISHLHARI